MKPKSPNSAPQPQRPRDRTSASSKTKKAAASTAATKKIRAWVFDDLIELEAIDLSIKIPPGMLMHSGWYLSDAPTDEDMTLKQALDVIGANREGDAIVVNIPVLSTQEHGQPGGDNVYYIFRPVTSPSNPSQEYRAAGCIWPVGAY
jgi:hypothetical protein